MFDEVQCGIGRTGKLFAHEHYGIRPDIIALAKGLGGGFPVGACVTTEEVGLSMGVGTHGSTFGGNPLAMAVANAVLDLVLADGFLDEVTSKGQYLSGGMKKLVAQYPGLIKSVDGPGLMIGVDCVIPNTELVDRLRDNLLIVGKAGGNSIRLLPALNVSTDQIDQCLGIIEKTLMEINGGQDG
jgi:acetylornithine/N-succinyldiaminopimelate aminotransferase